MKMEAIERALAETRVLSIVPTELGKSLTCKHLKRPNYMLSISHEI